jgi:hypothetical protein
MGGLSSGTINTNTTVTFTFTPTTTTANFSVATTSSFNGTVTASVKKTFPSKPVFAAENSSGTVTAEVRAPVSPTNTVIGVDAGGYISTGTNNTIFGYNANRNQFTTNNAVSIGSGATASNNLSVAIGTGSSCSGGTAVAINGTASGTNSISINGIASANGAIAIGRTSAAAGINQIVVGLGTSGGGAYTTYMGVAATSRTHLYGSLTMGTDTTSSGRLTVRGRGNTSTTKTAVFEDSGGSDIMVVQDNGVVGIGVTSPDASAKLEISSTTQGVLFPRMTTTQRDLISTPADGLVIYNTTDNKLQVRAAGAWVDLH